MKNTSISNSLIKLFFIVLVVSFVFAGSIAQISNLTLFKDKLASSSLALSTQQIVSLLRMEMPFLKDVQAVMTNQTEQGESWSTIFTMDPSNMANSWLIEEMPVLKSSINSVAMVDGSINYDIPFESVPPEDFFQAEKKKNAEEQPDEAENNFPTTTGVKKVVFIYHTHNRESFLPEIATNKISEAYHPTKNITLVGKRLGEELERLGIGTVVSTKDYWPELENYALSYKYSLQTVQAALDSNRDFNYVFDIHRDGIPGGKETTTKKINGKDYAAIFFVLGEANPHYKENKMFAEKINASLDKLYPGLSRGIIGKQRTSGTNGEYNQSVSTNSLTIEVGGAYNTLEEEYRTAKALAEAIADVYWDAQQVNAN